MVRDDFNIDKLNQLGLDLKVLLLHAINIIDSTFIVVSVIYLNNSYFLDYFDVP